ncbi:D-alanine--D-alanine ligase family protein [Ornithinimicrobium pekingense]|uniref:D-alanine--D-alanine ligase n=1 Tax=Ornithinimicrobium pekingense TaxID=384677 RepID=A0ABQ2F5F1_9MICO|nr:D-alanine--D-alanine ligase family protein [Ornithinimicrobium pekingense]GGK62767.1 D-alanine--D-alanine ligase [Ornithinimicrobium pekingense]
MNTDPAPHLSDAAATAPRTRVAIVFGGRSDEHAISCSTAASVLQAIDRDRYDVLPVGITREGHWVLVEDDAAALQIRDGRLPEVPGTGRQVMVPLGGVDHVLRVVERDGSTSELGVVDVVFPLLHGPFGEDGTIQGLLELADIRYVGCGVLASAAMMDKHVMKVLFASASLPVGPYTVITDLEWRRDRTACLDAANALSFPVFVKPARAGSSVGVYKVEAPEELEAAIEKARSHDPKVLVEEAIAGREVECGVLQGRGSDAPRISVPGEIAVVGGHEFYDFEAKYLDEGNVRITAPAAVGDEVREQMSQIARTAFEVAGCEGLARVDCFVTDSGEVLINEINTMPGFTPFSMYPQVWAASGVTYPELIDELVQLALDRPLGLR